MEDSDVLKEYRMISAYRRHKNLKDILVHTALNRDRQKKEALQVAQVDFIRLPFIFNPHSKTGINILQAFKPITKNAIYTIRCKACQKLYIGETKNKVILRIKQHIYKMRNGRGTSVLYEHFKIHGPHNIQGAGLESNQNWTTAQRRAAERKWIHRLKTITPNGLNEKY